MHVLNHESHHAKAKDNLIKLLYLIVCCVYWFAPVLWKGAKYLENIIELCCDSKAVVGYTKRDIDDYAICLSVLAGCNLDGLNEETAFSKGHGKTYGRIFNLINNEKIGFVEQVVGKVLAVLLIASMFVGVKFVSADDTVQNDANNSSYAVESMRVAEVDGLEEAIAYKSADNTVLWITGEN